MKNIFIGGVARSGKSTIAVKLQEQGNYNHIPLDYFTASLKRNFPETNISSNVVINETSGRLALLLSTVMNIINDKEELFIIDSAHIMPKDIINYIDREKWEIYYVGYPEISSNEKLKMIRIHDSINDWTSKRTDKDLIEIIDKLITISQRIEEECKELNIKFIDTSYNFNDVINSIR